MILYHGSDVLVKKPEIRESKVCLDFGKGFYTTTSYEQAERWSRVKIRRNNKQFGYVSIFEFNIDAAKKSTTIRKFDSADLVNMISEKQQITNEDAIQKLYASTLYALLTFYPRGENRNS